MATKSGPGPTHDPEALDVQRVLSLCHELGFAAAGVCDAAPTAWRKELVDWLESSRHGSMGYLKEHLPARLDPNLVLPGARSIIMVADVYAERGRQDRQTPPGHGRVARYARGRDYHRVIKKRLHALADALRADSGGRHQFRAFVDTAPVLEREYAARAGLGWIGKHTLLISPPRPVSRGSYTLLGGILSTMDLPSPPAVAGSVEVHDHCGACTRCIDACPTNAITPYSVDATRCISYLTIERRTTIDPEFHAAMGDWLYGCDVCQEVCPHNSAITTFDPAGSIRGDYAPRFEALDLHRLLEWTEADRGRILAGSAMKRATLSMLKRNALIVLANQALQPAAAPALRESLVARCRDLVKDASQDSLVTEAARQVLRRIEPPPTSHPR